MVAPSGRLTLTSGAPVTTADVTAATAIFLTPVNGNVSIVWNGTEFVSYVFSELTLALSASHAINTNYDVFDFVTDDALAIGSGPAWSTATSRGTGAGTTEVELFQGRWVNKYSITLRNGATTYTVPARFALLRGTFRTIGTAGQTEDSRTTRYLSNVFNATLRPMWQGSLSQLANNWTYSTASFRQANGSISNAVRYVQCLSGRPVEAHVNASVYTNNLSGLTATVGIGINSTTTNSSTRHHGAQFPAVFTALPTNAWYEGFSAIGFQEINWLEYGAGSATQTWFGYGGGFIYNSGIGGMVIQ
jgi:hypothetical protein